MHTLLDHNGNLPAYVNITNGKTAGNKGSYDIPLQKRSAIVADRFYDDFHLIWTTFITILILKALKVMARYNWHLSNLVAFT